MDNDEHKTITFCFFVVLFFVLLNSYSVTLGAYVQTKEVCHITIVGFADLQCVLGSSKNSGGVARIATIIGSVRDRNRNGTLVLVSGDDLMGRYFHTFEGKAIYSMFSALGLDAYAMGNYEFDNGCADACWSLKVRKVSCLVLGLVCCRCTYKSFM